MPVVVNLAFIPRTTVYKVDTGTISDELSYYIKFNSGEYFLTS